MTVLAAKLESLTAGTRLTHEEVGEIVGSSARSVSRWLAGDAEPKSDARRRLLELAYVAEELSSVMRPEDINLWIFSPNRLLDHDTPAERVRGGDFKSVLAVIEALADGIVT